MSLLFLVKRWWETALQLLPQRRHNGLPDHTALLCWHGEGAVISTPQLGDRESGQLSRWWRGCVLRTEAEKGVCVPCSTRHHGMRGTSASSCWWKFTARRWWKELTRPSTPPAQSSKGVRKWEADCLAPVLRKWSRKDQKLNSLQRPEWKSFGNKPSLLQV